MTKARIFMIVSRTEDDEGNVLLTEEKIQEALDHKTIKRWAYALHDKDPYTEEEEADHPEHVAGTPRPPHWQIVIECPKCAMPVESIARWFGLETNMIDIMRGRGAFLDGVEYLTHEREEQQLKGKHRYDDSEIKANFDWRAELNQRAVSKAKYGTSDITLKDKLRLDVLNGDKTLRAVFNEYPVNYASDCSKLEELRMQYLLKAPVPESRQNFYITGGSGVGKTVASEVLAHALYPNIEDDDDLFFRVGDKKTGFMGYDGEPVIIWDDFRAIDLLELLGSRGNVFNVFDTTPRKKRQNIKYGSVNLINEVNIVNSVQPWKEFLDGLVGEYEDKNGNVYTAEMNEKKQSYRRFPWIIPLRVEDFDILLNKGYEEGSDEYENYIKFQNSIGNFGRIAKAFPDQVEVVKVGSKMLEPMTDKIEEMKEKQKDDDDEERKRLQEEIYATYGKTWDEVAAMNDRAVRESDEKSDLDVLVDEYDIVF